MQYPATFELSTTDDLTGLLTAPYFRHLLREELLPESERTGDPLSLLLLDIDDFLEANNAHGRECGNAVLRGVTEILRASLPERAAISRYSGDEFAAALPDTRLDDAFTLAEEIRRRVVGMQLEGWSDVRVAASIGLAAYPTNGHSDVEMMRQADEALFTAKNTGRNKVSLPLADSRMITKTSHYTATQLERLAQLARTLHRNEAGLLREALDNLLKQYNDRLGAAPSE